MCFRCSYAFCRLANPAVFNRYKEQVTAVLSGDRFNTVCTVITARVCLV